MPVIIHSVQKLLNTSRLEAVQYISEPVKGQLLHSWYARLIKTGFPGKLLVIYVHEPSLLTVVCRGKTIKGSWVEFCSRLPALLSKAGFTATQIDFEMSQMDNYVVAKTNSRSMLGYMNDMAAALEWRVYASYESISMEEMEDSMFTYPYRTGNKNARYITSAEYWKNFLVGNAQ